MQIIAHGSMFTPEQLASMRDSYEKALDSLNARGNAVLERELAIAIIRSAQAEGRSMRLKAQAC